MTRSATATTRKPGTTGLIVGASLIVLALVIAVIAAKPGTGPATATNAAPAAAPAGTAVRASVALKARETAFEFGSISMAAGKVTHRYWFRNEIATPVLIRRIYTSCMCTTATLVKAARVIGSYGMPGHGPVPDVNEMLAPGEAAYVDVVFDPAAHGPAGLGRTERVVTIEHGAGEPLQIGFTADVKP